MKYRVVLNSSIVLAMALCMPTSWAAAPQSDSDTRSLAHDILKQLIEINTTDSVGSVTAASQAMAQRLLDAGFPKEDVVIVGPNERKKNMVARYRGKPNSKLRPVLIIGHVDVVEARREDWTTDPFTFIEKDGYYYGRGTQDMKEYDAILVTDFIRLRKEGFVPNRDIILALTADEEGGTSNGVNWLLQNRRDLIDDGGLRSHRETLWRLSGARHQSGRPQFAAEAGQCDLPRRGRSARAGAFAVSLRTESGDARIFRTNGQDRDRTDSR